MFNFTFSDQGNGPGISFNPALLEMNAPFMQAADNKAEFLFGETHDSTINLVEGGQVMPESASEIGVEIVASDDLVMSRTPEDEYAISLLSGNGFDILAKNIDEGKCLTWAAKEGHGAVLRLLLKGGADINARDVQHCARQLYTGRTRFYASSLMKEPMLILKTIMEIQLCPVLPSWRRKKSLNYY
jgi:hypothetical protein